MHLQGTIDFAEWRMRSCGVGGAAGFATKPNFEQTCGFLKSEKLK